MGAVFKVDVTAIHGFTASMESICGAIRATVGSDSSAGGCAGWEREAFWWRRHPKLHVVRSANENEKSKH